MMWGTRVHRLAALLLAVVVVSGCASRSKFPEQRAAQLVAPPQKILVVETYRGWKQFDIPLKSGLDRCGVATEFMNRENPAGGLFSGTELKNLIVGTAARTGADHVLEVMPGGTLEQTGSIRRVSQHFSFALTHLDSGSKVWSGTTLTSDSAQIADDLLAALVRDGALPGCPAKEARQ